MTGPPLSISMDFIAGGLVELIGGLASAVVLVGVRVVGAARARAAPGCATHWLLRESAVWRDRNTDEVRAAQRDADYAYRLAVDPPAAKELRLFGLAGWTIDRFVDRRTRLHELQYEATRLREKPVLWSLLLVVGANVVVFWSLADRAATAAPRASARSSSSRRARVGTSMIAFGGLNWALDGAAAPVAAVLRLEPAMAPGGRARDRARVTPTAMPAREIRFRDVTFAYPGGAARCSTASTSRSRPARRWRSSARTAPARPRWPSCCAGSTTRSPARSRSTASTCASFDLDAWRVARHRRVPGLHPLRAAAARQRRARAARPTT